jgi:hypothetical protein
MIFKSRQKQTSEPDFRKKLRAQSHSTQTRMKQHRVIASPQKHGSGDGCVDGHADDNKENEYPVLPMLFPVASFRTPVKRKIKLVPTGVYVQGKSLVPDSTSVMKSDEECKYKRRRCDCSMFDFAANPHGLKQTCDMCMKSKRELCFDECLY